MQIHLSQKQNSPHFKAVKVATTKNTAKNVTTQIDLYRLNPRHDSDFLKNLKDRIDFRKLFPKLNEFETARWQQIFNYTIDSAADSEYTAYLAISDNKPCGILSYLQNGDNNTFIDAICSIPTEVDKKVRKVGSTLILQAFKDASENNSKEIVLDAVNNGPFNIIEKYKNFGFKPHEVSIKYTTMRCNKNNREEQIKQLKKEIEYHPISSNENVDLNQFLR